MPNLIVINFAIRVLTLATKYYNGWIEFEWNSTLIDFKQISTII